MKFSESKYATKNVMLMLIDEYGGMTGHLSGYAAFVDKRVSRLLEYWY